MEAAGCTLLEFLVKYSCYSTQEESTIDTLQLLVWWEAIARHRYEFATPHYHHHAGWLDAG
jgi:hypothetical protein